MKKRKKAILSFTLLAAIAIVGYFKEPIEQVFYPNKSIEKQEYHLSNLPPYDGKSYIYFNQNKPNFNEEDYKSKPFERYQELDSQKRTGVAMANIDYSMMPTEKRSSIGMIKPSGWHTVKYEHINGKYLYNRCHLIGYQLTGENANPNNLITCTRSMNVEGMLPFENLVAQYIKETKNSVLYRVTPIYQDSDLLASGVIIEASSIYDRCTDICFSVFVYNVQDGVKINYETGESHLQ